MTVGIWGLVCSAHAQVGAPTSASRVYALAAPPIPITDSVPSPPRLQTSARLCVSGDIARETVSKARDPPPKTTSPGLVPDLA